MDENKEDAIHFPIDGILDLHTFDPKDVPDLLKEYLYTCLENGIYEIRIIHGKGRGILRDKVHSILKNHPMVMDFRLDDGPSGWGASIARLRKDTNIDSVTVTSKNI